MRLFLAINLPSAQRSAIRAATEEMRAAAPVISWVSEERLHLTLKFLGEQEDSTVYGLRARMRDVASNIRPMTLTLGGLGAFPNLLQPRIVWMGVAHEARLELLHHDVESACASLGVALEGRAFRPHLTLGRAKKPVSRAIAVALRSAARATDFQSTIEVSTVDLMESKLSAAGSRYAVLDAAPLGGD
ncbi:MAG: RNA 2',3'-cyclic phosphodiesterase [Anaerolineae bacterium]|nr:RNA 2',3'-cyclic phosphodiesterase [Gemmatimonadaceae bacterium]